MVGIRHPAATIVATVSGLVEPVTLLTAKTPILVGIGYPATTVIATMPGLVEPITLLAPQAPVIGAHNPTLTAIAIAIIIVIVVSVPASFGHGQLLCMGEATVFWLQMRQSLRRLKSSHRKLLI